MDRNLDERLRKPRRTRGTPFVQTRNYLSVALLAFGAFSLYLFEKIPAVQRLKHDLIDSDRFKSPPEVREHIQSAHISLNEPELRNVISRYRERQLAKSLVTDNDASNETPKEQPWYSKLYETNQIPKNTSQQTETISRYFKKVTLDPMNQSVYQDAITEAQNDASLNQSNLSDGDFVSPPKVKKIAKIFTDVKENVTRRATGRKATKKSMLTEEKKLLALGKHSDVNIEHLQLALAMSKSMEPELVAAQADVDAVCPSTPPCRDKIRIELLRYRLNARGQSSTRPNSSDVVKTTNKKKSRFRYVKPKLFIRTEEERARLIQDKIVDILSHGLPERPTQTDILDCETSHLHSFVLQEYINRNRKVFNAAQQIERDIAVYYVVGLEMGGSRILCGSLLKKWELIPGREQSPERNVNLHDLQAKNDALHCDSVNNERNAAETQKKDLEESKSVDTNCRIEDFPAVLSDAINESFYDELTKNITTSQFLSVSQQNNTLDTDNLYINARGDIFESICSKNRRLVDSGSYSQTSFTSVSQTSRKLIRSVSPDLFTSSDEEILDRPEKRSSNTDTSVEIEQTQMHQLGSAPLLSNINAVHEKNKDETLESEQHTTRTSDEQVDIEHATNIDVSIDDKDDYDHNEIAANKTKIEKFGSASLLSNVNAKNIKDTSDLGPLEVDSNELGTNFEVDDRGICTYESFCDVNTVCFDQSVLGVHSRGAASGEHRISPSTKRNLSTERLNLELPVAGDNLQRTNERMDAKLLEVGGAGACEVTDVTDSSVTNVNQDNVNNSNITNKENGDENDSDDSDNDNSLAVAHTNRKSWMNLDVTDHVQALLNSNTFVERFQSICIEKYFNSACDKTPHHVRMPGKSNSLEQSKNAKQDGGQPHEAFIDFPEDATFCDGNNDECIDLSQDSDDNADSASSKTTCVANFKHGRSLERNLSSRSLNSTTSTNDSICINDEELNYSCLNATVSVTPRVEPGVWKYSKLALKKNTFEISDSEDDDQDVDVNQEYESVDVTLLLHAIKQRKEKENNQKTGGKSNVDCERFQNDDALQEALKLSLIHAENDERHCQSTEETHKPFEDKMQSQTINRNENDVHEGAENDGIVPNGAVDVEGDFADSLPPFAMDLDKYEAPEENAPGNLGASKKARVSMSLNNDATRFTQCECHDNVELEKSHLDFSFPSFDHDNFDHCGADRSLQALRTSSSSKTLRTPCEKGNSGEEHKPDEFDLLVESGDSIFRRHSASKRPQCRRIQQLTNANQTPVKQLNNSEKAPLKSINISGKSNSARARRIPTTARASGMFEDTFADLLERTNVLSKLDNVQDIPAQQNDEQLRTPPSGKGLNACAATPATPADGLCVKTVAVTPMPAFDQMSTPEIHSELDKIGVKHMKRRRGLQLLKHVYNAMHLRLEKQAIPEVADVDVDDSNRPTKRRKKLNYDEVDQPNHRNGGVQEGHIDINTLLADSEPLEDMIFERKQSKKIQSCALPLHIAWHNFLCVNRDIWENVLLYEPLQVEVMYAMLKDVGFKYHIQDLITFFDKKCITIRIKQNK